MSAKRYYIVTERNRAELEAAVNAAIDGDGAVPIGGVSVSWELGWRHWMGKDRRGRPVFVQRFGLRQIFHQAMIDLPDDGPPASLETDET